MIKCTWGLVNFQIQKEVLSLWKRGEKQKEKKRKVNGGGGGEEEAYPHLSMII